MKQREREQALKEKRDLPTFTQTDTIVDTAMSDNTGHNTGHNTGETSSLDSAYTQDAQQPQRLVDQAATAKPTVDYQDKLWTQIDVLDDVRQMAAQTRQQQGGARASALRELKQRQLAVATRIREQEQLMDAHGSEDEGNKGNKGNKGFDRAFFTQLDSLFTQVEQEMDNVGEQLRELNQ